MRKKLKFQKPKRSHKNFYDFCRSINPSVYPPCVRCNGTKIIIDPQEPPDVIEGHKLSRRIKCPSCGGSGKSDIKTVKQKYREECDRHKDSMRKYMEASTLLKNAMRKLTDEELYVLSRVIRGYTFF